jgi:hypothetical protein
MLYKGATKDIIINNLPDNVFVDVARVALVFDLFFTFIVVIVPARDIIEVLSDSHNSHGGAPRQKDLCLRLTWHGRRAQTSLLTPNQRWNTIKRYAIRYAQSPPHMSPHTPR